MSDKTGVGVADVAREAFNQEKCQARKSVGSGGAFDQEKCQTKRGVGAGKVVSDQERHLTQ